MTQSVCRKPSIRLVYLLNTLPIIGLLVFYYTHYLEGMYSFIIPLGLTSVWMVMTILMGKMKGLLTNKISIWWMAYLFICVMMVILGFSSNNLNFIISRLPYYLIPVMGYFVIKHYNRKEKSVLLALFFFVFLLNLFYNILLGFQFPDIFEEQESTEASIEFGVIMNIAETGFIVVAYCLIGALFMVLLTLNEKWKKILSILLIVPIAFYMLFQNTRGTAILLLMIELVGMFLAYFEPTRRTNRRLYYVFSTVTLLLLVLIVFIPLMEWLMENLQSERLAERLNDLVDYRQSGGDVGSVRKGSFTERILLAQTSLNSFISSPISLMVGIGDHTLSIGGDLVKSGVGNHSEFIDVLARYGLVGAFVFWKIMKSYYEMLLRLTTKRESLKYVNVIFVVIILTGFLNNLFYPIVLLFMYLIFPLIIEISDQKISYPNGK